MACGGSLRNDEWISRESAINNARLGVWTAAGSRKSGLGSPLACSLLSLWCHILIVKIHSRFDRCFQKRVDQGLTSSRMTCMHLHHTQNRLHDCPPHVPSILVDSNVCSCRARLRDLWPRRNATPRVWMAQILMWSQIYIWDISHLKRLTPWLCMVIC